MWTPTERDFVAGGPTLLPLMKREAFWVVIFKRHRMIPNNRYMWKKKTPPPTSLEDKLPEIGWYFQVECQEKCHVSCDCVRLGVMYDPSWLCAKHQIKGTGFLWDMLPIARCWQWSIDPLLAITLRRMFLRVDRCPWWRPISNFAICEKKGRNRW